MLSLLWCFMYIVGPCLYYLLCKHALSSLFAFNSHYDLMHLLSFLSLAGHFDSMALPWWFLFRSFHWFALYDFSGFV